MKKIWEKIKAFVSAPDKWLHFLAAYTIASVIYILVIHVQPWWVADLIGAGVASLAIAVKEIWDKQNPDKHSFEVGDIIAGALGVLLLILTSLINLD